MNLCFLPTSVPFEPYRLPDLDVDFSGFRRPFGVALAAALAALLHGAILFWFLERPVSEPPTLAMPLPMIDIALAAPSQPAPPQPVEVAKPLPKPNPAPKPLKKPKPKRKPQPKKAAVEEKPSEEIQEASPVAAAPPAPVKAEAASPRAETYTPVSSNANYLNNPKPVYPSIARRRYWEGLVLLRVLVTAQGHCGKVSVNRSSGHEALDESALKAVRKWRFVPAKRGGVAQATWVTVPIEFELR
ncbi:MAG: energy transducer TonB [Methylocella sp.]